MTTYKARIEALAAKADFSPRAAYLLKNFFLDLTTQEEEDELDLWMNESEANGEMFDLLIEVNADGTGAGTIALLHKLGREKTKKKFKFHKGIWIGILVILGVSTLDHFLPKHPIASFLSGGKEIRDFGFFDITVETGEETKQIWLYDSTLVELLPHSKIVYPPQFYPHSREIELTGAAKFTVAKWKGEPLRVETGKVWMTCPEGVFTLEQEKDLSRGTISAGTGAVKVGYTRRESWIVEPGEKGHFADGAVKIERP